jgi:hypothetical protein
VLITVEGEVLLTVTIWLLELIALMFCACAAAEMQLAARSAAAARRIVFIVIDIPLYQLSPFAPTQTAR